MFLKITSLLNRFIYVDYRILFEINHKLWFYFLNTFLNYQYCLGHIKNQNKTKILISY